MAAVVVLAATLPAAAATVNKWNQSAAYSISLDLDGWSNYYATEGGCVTCPYTCVTPTVGPDGATLNASNASSTVGVPAIYSTTVSNGCCYAATADSKVMPSCSAEANPATAEDCGFLYGPTLSWRINDALEPTKKLVVRFASRFVAIVPFRSIELSVFCVQTAILFATTDCKNFWAVQKTPVKYTDKTAASVKGKKMMNSGCYGDPRGSAMVLAGCLTTELKVSVSFFSLCFDQRRLDSHVTLWM